LGPGIDEVIIVFTVGLPRCVCPLTHSIVKANPAEVSACLVQCEALHRAAAWRGPGLSVAGGWPCLARPSVVLSDQPSCACGKLARCPSHLISSRAFL